MGRRLRYRQQAGRFGNRQSHQIQVADKGQAGSVTVRQINNRMQDTGKYGKTRARKTGSSASFKFDTAHVHVLVLVHSPKKIVCIQGLVFYRLFLHLTKFSLFSNIWPSHHYLSCSYNFPPMALWDTMCTLIKRKWLQVFTLMFLLCVLCLSSNKLRGCQSIPLIITYINNAV